MLTLIAVIGALAFLVGLVCLIRPLPAIRVSNRVRATGVMGVSLMVVVTAVGLANPLPTEEPDLSDTLVQWEEPDYFWDYKVVYSLVYQDGAMIWRSQYQNGMEDFESVVVERHAPLPSVRRFDTQPGSPRTEYLTLSPSGELRFFTWKDREFAVHEATYMHPNAMEFGLAPVASPVAAR